MKANIPKLAPHEGSWVVVCKTSGRAVTEVFKGDCDYLHRVDSSKFYIETIGMYLARVNREAGR